MSVVQVMYHHEDTGLCQTTFKEVESARYFNRTESGGCGRWYTVYPYKGYWENSSEVRDDVTFEVLDSQGNLLFTESNGGLGAFCSIGEKAKAVAKEWAAKLGLHTYEEWRSWLERSRSAQDKGYIENWLHYDPEAQSWETIGEYSHLGIKFAVISAEMLHPKCRKRWRMVYIENRKTGECEAICGYVLGLERCFMRGEEFTASCKQWTNRYRFVGIEPLASPCYDVHLENLEDGTDIYVEPEWFETHKIERSKSNV